MISDMGFLVDSQEGGGTGGSWGCVRTLIRRKQVDSARVKSGGHQLAKALSVAHLIAIGNFLCSIFFFYHMLSEFFVLVCFICVLGQYSSRVKNIIRIFLMSTI